MNYRVEVSHNAEQEAEAIYEWIRQNAEREAVRWWNGLERAVESLAELPLRCSLAPENDFFHEEIRQLVYGKSRYRCRIIFTIEDHRVVVLHIRRGLRAPLQP